MCWYGIHSAVFSLKNICAVLTVTFIKIAVHQAQTISLEQNSRHLPKDERVLHHQRSAILTEELVANRYALYQEMKAERNSTRRKAKLSYADKVERNKKRRSTADENIPPAKRRGRPRKSNSAVASDIVIL